MKRMLETLRDFIRPLSVVALIGVLLVGAVTSGLLELFRAGTGTAFTVGVAGWFRAVPDAFYQLTVAALLGYTAGRTFEKTAESRRRRAPTGHERPRYGGERHRAYAVEPEADGGAMPDDPDRPIGD